MKIGILGYGPIGETIYERCSVIPNIEIAGVYCMEPEKVPDGKGLDSADALLSDFSIDTIVEIIGGNGLAYDLIVQAMNNGKNVVTNNTELTCTYLQELSEIASDNNVSFKYTAAIGGVQWISNLDAATRTDKIKRVYGIMDATSNYILSSMQSSKSSYEDAYSEANGLGYINEIRDDDVTGVTSKRRLMVAAGVAFGAKLSENDVDAYGITTITQDDFAVFARLGLTCKLFSSASVVSDSQMTAFVEPTLFGPKSLESCVNSNYNIFSFEGNVCGKYSFFGQGNGKSAIATTIINDIIDCANGLKSNEIVLTDSRKVMNARVVHQYYVRTSIICDWITDHRQIPLGHGILTSPISVTEMHKSAKILSEQDDKLFFAAIY